MSSSLRGGLITRLAWGSAARKFPDGAGAHIARPSLTASFHTLSTSTRPYRIPSCGLSSSFIPKGAFESAVCVQDAPSHTRFLPTRSAWSRRPLQNETSSAWARHSLMNRARWKSTESEGQVGQKNAIDETRLPQPKPPSSSPRTSPPLHEPEHLTDQVSKYLHLPHIPHLPKIPPRPTKEDLLAAATGFWQRLKIRFKWLTIRSMRPWNADEWGAFVGWILMGHLVWILVGTTTFFSLLILTVNTVFAQETLGRWVGDYLTQAAGVTVVFESAIVPKWKDGVITFHNVFVSRRPGQVKSSVTKGSSVDAAAAAAAAQAEHDLQNGLDDGNYTQFDVTINEVNVTLSFAKWWNSKGVLRDVEVKGVRGVVDRTSVHWSSDGRSPLSYRHEAQPGDFEIEHFKLEDLLVTVHQPNGFRPFSISIYSCELPQLRKQWLFYDLLCATHMSGSFDGSLFTLHPKQIHGIPAGDERNANDNLGVPQAWKKFSRMRIDGLKIDHLNRGVEGTFGWIHEGNVDIVADVMIPADPDEGLGKLMSDFYDKMEDAVTSNRYIRILDTDLRKDAHTFFTNINDTHDARPEFVQATHGHLSFPEQALDHADTITVHSTTEHRGHQLDTSIPAVSPEPLPHDDSTTTITSTTAPSASPSKKPDDTTPPSYLVMDLRIHLNDVRAAVPVFHATPGLSYVNQTLIRPIVAYINAKHTYIPISCRIVKRHEDFDGSWSVFDCGLMNDLSAEVYSAFARDVEDQNSRIKRLRKVGFWAVSVALQALLVGVAGDLLA